MGPSAPWLEWVVRCSRAAWLISPALYRSACQASQARSSCRAEEAAAVGAEGPELQVRLGQPSARSARGSGGVQILDPPGPLGPGRRRG